MNENDDVSRRSAAALAAALAATVVTAIAAVGGLQHWVSQAQAPQVSPAQLAHAPVAQPLSEEGD